MAHALSGSGGTRDCSGSPSPRSWAAPAARSRTCARWSTRPPPRLSPARWRPRPWRRCVIPGDHSAVLEALVSGERIAGVALAADLTSGDGRVSGTAEYVLGADAAGVLLLPAGDGVVLIDAGADGVTVEALKADRLLPAAGPRRARFGRRRGAAGVAAAVRGPGRHGAGGRGRRPGPLDAADRDRVREGARAVRQADRQLPGHQAHVRRDAAALRAGLGGRGRRAAARWPNPTMRSCPSPRRWPRPPASRPPRPTPRTASRCSAVSASPGSTTRICICGAHTAFRGSSAAGALAAPRRGVDAARACAAACTSIWTRSSSCVRRSPPRSAEVAALPAEKRQVALAEAGLLAPHWPRAVRPRRLAGRAAADRPGAGRGRGGAPGPGDRVVGGADDPRARQPPSRSNSSCRPRCAAN